MELKMLKLALEKLYDEVEKLKQENQNLKEKIRDIILPFNKESETKKEDDELMDTKQVLNYLGICYNTLQSIIQKGLLKPIRINQRRIRFSKRTIISYVRSLEKVE